VRVRACSRRAPRGEQEEREWAGAAGESQAEPSRAAFPSHTQFRDERPLHFTGSPPHSQPYKEKKIAIMPAYAPALPSRACRVATGGSQAVSRAAPRPPVALARPEVRAN
jgi:hypothetical protein